jgi:sugar/nucleoside kinase (ribokinase family)
MLHAASIARTAERKVAFTLSESLCLDGRREGVWRLIADGAIDILFANEDEATHLTGSADLDTALERLKPLVETLVVTRGAAGALALQGSAKTVINAVPVEQVVDTTGAGDLFAAGFLTARCRGHGIDHCLETGALAAAEIISHFGARPEADLRQLVRL